MIENRLLLAPLLLAMTMSPSVPAEHGRSAVGNVHAMTNALDAEVDGAASLAVR